jgi:hypothetical protein
MAGRGVFALVRSLILAQPFIHPIGRRTTLLPPTASDPGTSAICHGISLSPRRPGPVRRGIALITAAVFAVLPPLQTVSAADDGQRAGASQGAPAAGQRRPVADAPPHPAGSAA